MSEPLVVSDRVTVPGQDLTWVAVRASGPGGQNVNKVSSKVELRFDLPGTLALSPQAKARLQTLARTRLDREGCLLIASQKTRDQRKNLDDARTKLAELIALALVVPVVRRPTRPTLGSKRRRVAGKRHDAAKREQRRGKADD